MNNILDKNAPFKKIAKCKLKLKTKSWITTAIRKSISIKNEILQAYFKKKGIIILSQKNKLQNNYKTHIVEMIF